MFAFLGRGLGAKDTFRPLKQHKNEKRHTLHRYCQATLATGITRAAVACPPSEDLNEWLAVHTVDAYNEISLLYGVIANNCTPAKDACKVMNAGAEFEYLWADNNLYKKPTKVSARQYAELLMSWIEEQLNDESLFPTSTESAFPRNFRQTVSKIFSRLFRVYGHIYLCHVADMERAGAMSHLNSCFKHFIYFAIEFDLIDERERVPLQALIRTILEDDTKRKVGGDAAAEGGR